LWATAPKAALLLLLALPVHALDVTPLRFARPIAIDALHIWQGLCSPGESDAPHCLNIDYAVVHRRADGTTDHDTATYPLDPLFVERVAADFGGFAPVALREADTALETMGLLEDDELRPVVERCRKEIQRTLHYRVQPHVRLTLPVEHRVSQLADHFFAKARRELVITSGTRSPEEQATAMYLKLILRSDLRRLYRKWEAAQEIKRAYSAGWTKRLRRPQIIAAMADVIRAQMKEGIYVSPHLKAGAVDIRSRSWRAGTKAAFQRAAASFSGLRLLREEKTPPHFHLEILDTDPTEEPQRR